MSTQGYSFVMREFSRCGITVVMNPPYTDYELRCPEGTSLADYFKPRMIRHIEGAYMDNFFRWGLLAQATKCEPIVCNVCDECQICSNNSGTPSAKKKCAMTPHCDGTLCRIRPPVFALKMPRRPRKARV